MGSVTIKECSVEKIKDYKKRYVLRKIYFDDGYFEVSIDNVPRALIALTKANYHEGWENVISIDAFEVFEKNKGYGSLIIEEMKGSKLFITPLESAIKFWTRHGFKHFEGEDYINFDYVLEES